MKRVVLALVCGLLWPALLFFILYLIATLDWAALNWFGNIILGIFMWPYYLLVYIFPTPLAMPGGDVPRTEVFYAFWLVHAVSFALPFYLVLRLFARPRWR